MPENERKSVVQTVKKRMITFGGAVWGILTAYSIYVILGYPAEFPHIMLFFNLILLCEFAALYPIYRFFGWDFT